jgi:hypothetical protein
MAASHQGRRANNRGTGLIKMALKNQSVSDKHNEETPATKA